MSIEVLSNCQEFFQYMNVGMLLDYQFVWTLLQLQLSTVVEVGSSDSTTIGTYPRRRTELERLDKSGYSQYMVIIPRHDPRNPKINIFEHLTWGH